MKIAPTMTLQKKMQIRSLMKTNSDAAIAAKKKVIELIIKRLLSKPTE
ncbi:MAG: hypothetical protein K0Q73_4614 [Paenibacillus sp.]|nr:hypothetical protein [Paenibacillus sp.]